MRISTTAMEDAMMSGVGTPGVVEGSINDGELLIGVGRCGGTSEHALFDFQWGLRKGLT